MGTYAGAGAREDFDTEEEKPSEEELNSEEFSAIKRLVRDAIEYVEEELSPERAELAEYYEGRLPDVQAPEGRSAAVSPDIRQAINAMRPGLLRIFHGPERVVELRPRGPEDEQAAKQRTEYLNYVITEDNPGFCVSYDVIEDALVKEYGVASWGWNERVEARGMVYEGITEAQLEMLAADPEITIGSLTPGAEPGFYARVELTRQLKTGRAEVFSVPPDEFFFDRSATSLKSALVVGRQREMRVSELVEMGYDYETVLAHAGADQEVRDDEESLQRAPTSSTLGDEDYGHDPNKKVLYVEAYPFWDVDGDKVAELRRVCMIGPELHIIANDAAEERPFALFMADMVPHALRGRSIGQRIRYVQKIKSVILRGMLDSLNLTLNPGTEVVEGEVNMQDVLNSEIGRVIRVRRPGMLREVEHRFVGADALPVLAYYDENRENDTGTSKAAAGLNPDALQSSTKAAVAATVTASQQQVELVARLFAETGFKQLYGGVYRLLKRHQDVPRMVKITGQYVEMDPSAWDEADPDIRVNVALGMGMVEERIQGLLAIASKQEGYLQTLGPDNPLTSLAQLRNTLAMATELMGHRDASRFWKEVDPNWQPAPAPPPPPDPAMAAVELETMKAQAEQAMKAQEFVFRQQMEQDKLAFEQQKEIWKQDLERDRMLMELELEAKKLELEYKTKIETARIQAEIKAITAPAPTSGGE